MDYRPDETWHRLREWTYGQAPSERLAAQVILYAGYRDLDPTHPLGGPDGGKDAISQGGKKTVMAVYFPRGAQPFSSIQKKFLHDLKGAKENQASAIAFVTNQEITDAERQILRGHAAPIELDLYHLERITSILDTPDMEPVRRQFLYIDRRSLNPTSNRADLFVQISDNYSRARPFAKQLVTTFLPPDEFLDYLTHYNFRSGRVPIDKQTAIGNLYSEISFVRALTQRRGLTKYPDVFDALQSELRLQILNALPALGVFYQKLKEHYLSIYEVTASEAVPNPTYLGLFRSAEEIDPSAANFASRVFQWESTARELATAYRTGILGERVF